jgi:glycosyltransferase involved in cell wall biosynthesis
MASGNTTRERTANARRRMAYLVSRYPAVSHTFILREVLALRARGFEIHAASINPPGAAPDGWTAEEKAETTRTYCVKATPKATIVAAHARAFLRSPGRYLSACWFAARLGGADLKLILYGLFYFVEAVLVARWMEQLGLTHLHVHFATPAASVGLIVPRLIPATLSMTVHGPDEFYDVSQYRLAEKIGGASFVCAIGSFARSQLMKLSPPEEWHKFEITPLGVDPQIFAPRPAPALRPEFEVICVGRLTPAKGQHVLVSAIARLRDEGRRVRLRLVGDGPDRQSLERAVRTARLDDRVVFEGAVNQDRIRDLYRSADAFVLASFAEGIPVVLMEAMAMEIPCVTTWITGIPELIRDSVDGLLTPPSDERALAGAIARLMDDAGLRERLGRSGRQRVIERYNLRPNVDRLAEVFEARLGGAVKEARAAS